MKPERPTISLTTTHGFEVVLREWITQQDYREIMRIYSEAKAQLKNVDAKKGTADVETSSHLVDASLRAQDFSIEKVVVSINGNTSGLVSFIMNEMPRLDAEEVIKAVEAITNPKSEETSPTTSVED